MFTHITPEERAAFDFINRNISILYAKADKNPGEMYSCEVPDSTVRLCAKYIWEERSDRPHNCTTPMEMFQRWVKENEAMCHQSVAQDGHWVVSVRFPARIYKTFVAADQNRSLKDIMEHGPSKISIIEVIGRDYDLSRDRSYQGA